LGTRGLGDFWQHTLVAEGAVDIAWIDRVGLGRRRARSDSRGSGGRWSTVDGASDVNGGSFVCTNGRLHDAVLAALA